MKAMPTYLFTAATSVPFLPMGKLPGLHELCQGGCVLLLAQYPGRMHALLLTHPGVRSGPSGEGP
jgi:hypothetical protein